ncbi:hypothetical protein U1701_01485 [Sphingomonas sp. PB2P19]|uniref:hypothetical protein n=1 Tax=Sphingomonas rhamnosi TaxID=3096156 RepID=UPI002FCCA6DF
MRADELAAGERTGHMDTSHGHEWVYDPPSKQAPQVVTESMEMVALRRRHNGWTAERQRMVLNTLANTGSIGLAAEAADITPRSAYRLRNHPKGAGFARAWDAALMRAGGRLITARSSAPPPARRARSGARGGSSPNRRSRRTGC